MFIIMDNSGSQPTFEEIFLQYCKNQRDFNDNIRTYLDMMLLRERQRNQNNIRVNTNRNTQPIFNGATNVSSIFPQFRMSPYFTPMQDVIVSPSYNEIDRATEIIVYNENDDHPNSSCPITLESFTNESNICRIKQCRHIFKTTALYNWFRTNVRCPVCRYDIRDYQSDTPSSQSPTSTVSDPSFNRVESNTDIFANTLTDAIRGFVNNELSSMNEETRNNVSHLLYTFDIPFTSDSSGNFSSF